MADRLKNVGWVFVGAIVLYWMVTTLVGTVFGGPLDPPAAPAPTQKTQITSLPITINSSGSYILMSDLTCASCTPGGTNGITITADNVDIDLNGFALIGPGKASASGDGIRVTGSFNIRIHNGTVRDWKGDGVDVSAINSQLENLRAFDNGGDGLRIFDYGTIRNCNAMGNGGVGIFAVLSTVIGCTSSVNAVGFHVDGSLLRDCKAESNSGDGIQNLGIGGAIEGCYAISNGGDGIEVFQGIRVVGNDLVSNGIHVTQSGNHIEGNTIVFSGTGIDANPATGNIIIKNSATQNTTDYDIAAGNTVGPILGAADPIASTNPWANFSY